MTTSTTEPARFAPTPREWRRVGRDEWWHEPSGIHVFRGRGGWKLFASLASVDSPDGKPFASDHDARLFAESIAPRVIAADRRDWAERRAESEETP